MEKYDFLESILKETAPTPSYVFDLDLLFEHVEKVKNCFAGKARVCYAMKANPFLTGPMLEHVDLFEVCSPGEFRICERNGIPMEKIVLSGVYKNPEDIQYVLRTYKGKGVYTVESWEHLRHLIRLPKNLEWLSMCCSVLPVEISLEWMKKISGKLSETVIMPIQG